MRAKILKMMQGVLFLTMLIRQSLRACTISLISNPSWVDGTSGGYWLSGSSQSYNSPYYPMAMLVTLSNGKTVYYLDLNNVYQGSLLPFIDLFYGLFQFSGSSSTRWSCYTSCTYQIYDASTDQCGTTDVSGIDTLLGGYDFFDDDDIYNGYKWNLKRTSSNPSPSGNSYNLDQTLHPSCLTCDTSASGGNSLTVKNLYYSLPYCAQTGYVTDYTTAAGASNSYTVVGVAPQIFNLQGLQASSTTDCPIYSIDLEFESPYSSGISSVPGLTENSSGFCEDRTSAGDCDGSSDYYLNWSFTQNYAALQIRLRVTMTNSQTHTSQIISLKVELCDNLAGSGTIVTWSGLNGPYLVLQGQSSPTITASAASDHTDCTVISDGYGQSSSESWVTVASTGGVTIDSTDAKASTQITLQAKVGPQNEIFTSPSFNVQVLNCLDEASFPAISDQIFNYSESPSTIQVGDPTHSASCNFQESTYAISPTITGVSIDQSGLITVDTSTVLSTTTFKVSGQLGYQTLYSSNFDLQVLEEPTVEIVVEEEEPVVVDCSNYISFPNLLTSYSGEIGRIYSFINVTAESNSTNCVIDKGSYNLTSFLYTETGIKMNRFGNLHIKTSDVMTIQNHSISIIATTDGKQSTVYSFNFTIEVVKLQELDIVEKFEDEPLNVTEIKLGEIKWINLGRFEGNGLDIASVIFEVQDATNEDLKNAFKVFGSFDRSSQRVNLKIDLRKFEPPSRSNFTRRILQQNNDEPLNVSGELQIQNLLQDLTKYDITFKLVNEYSLQEVSDSQEEELDTEEDTSESEDTILDELAKMFSGFDEEVKNEGEKIKSELPSISISDISPLGLVTLKFNQNFSVPIDWQKIDYSHIMKIELISGEDGSLVRGEFNKNLPERILKDRKSKSNIRYCLGNDCAALRNGFSWSIKNHTNQEMKIQIDFENKFQISRSVEGYDKLQMHFPLIQYFRTEKTFIKLKKEHIQDRKKCKDRAILCESFPPLMKSQEEVDLVENAAGSLSDTISGVVASNLFLSMFMAGLVSQILGVVRLLQILLLQAVIFVSYPAHVNYFYTLVVGLADMDLLNGPDWYEVMFDFKETDPYNDQFDAFGMGDLNLLNNTASLYLVFLGMLITWFFWRVVHRISIKYYRSKRARQIGIYANESAPLKIPLLELVLDAYTDLILGGFLGSVDIYRQFAKEDPLQELFSNFSNGFHTIVTIIVTTMIVVLPFYMKYHIQMNYKELKEKEIKEELGVFYSEYRTDSHHRALYGYYSIIRRLILVVVLVFLDDLPWLQAMLIMVNCSVFFVLTAASSPFNSTYNQRLEVFNEAVVLLCSHINMNFFLQARGEQEVILENLKDTSGWFLVALIVFNIAVSLLLVVISSLKGIIISLIQLPDKIRQRRDEQKFQKSRAKIMGSDAYEGRMKRYKYDVEEREAIEFCKEFQKERQWCYDNGLDYRDLEEEKLFQTYLKKFRFKRKKEICDLKNKVLFEAAEKIEKDRKYQIHQKVDEKMRILMNEENVQSKESSSVPRITSDIEQGQNIETGQKKTIIKKANKKMKKKKAKVASNLDPIKEDPEAEDEITVIDPSQSDRQNQENQRNLMFEELKNQKIEYQEHQINRLQDRVNQLKKMTVTEENYGSDLSESENDDSDPNSVSDDVSSSSQDDEEQIKELSQQKQILMDNEFEEAIDFEIERLNSEKKKSSKSKSEKKMLFDFALQKSKKHEVEAIKLAQELLEKMEDDESQASDEEQEENYEFAIDHNFAENIKVVPLASQQNSQVIESKDEQELSKEKIIQDSDDQEDSEPEATVESAPIGVLQLEGNKILCFLLQCLIETPFLMDKLETEELDFLVNQKEESSVSICESLQDLYLAKISDKDPSFQIEKIAKFMENIKDLNAEQQLYKILQKIHVESKVTEGDKLKFYTSMIKYANPSKEPLRLQSFLICNQSLSFVSRNLTQLIQINLVCKYCKKETLSYQEQIFLEVNWKNGENLQDCIEEQFEGKRQVLRACSKCHQMRIHSMTQKFLVTPKVLIIMVTTKPQAELSALDLKTLDMLNEDLIRVNRQYVIPGSLESNDLNVIYKDEYRKLKEVIRDQPYMSNPTQDDINSSLSPCDSFSLKDDISHQEFQALFTKLDPLDDEDYHYFNEIAHKVDLQAFVNTNHVEDLNSRQDQRRKQAKEWEKKTNKMTKKEKLDMLKLTGGDADEFDKRTVNERYAKLKKSGFTYELFAIYEDQQALVLKSMTQKQPKQWYAFGKTNHKKIEEKDFAFKPEILFYTRC